MNLIKHILFWFIISFILIISFGKSYGSFKEAFNFVCLLLPVAIGTAYYFNYYLVPYYLLKEKLGKFILYTFYLLVIALNLEMLVITAAFAILAEYNYNNMNPVTTDVSILTITIFSVVFVISIIRLVKMNVKHLSTIDKLQTQQEKENTKSISITSNRKVMNIDLDTIYFIESLNDFILIHYKLGEPIKTNVRISKIQEQLPSQFVRIHRSYVVNKRLITSFNKECVVTNELELPISRSYKADALNSLQV